MLWKIAGLRWWVRRHLGACVPHDDSGQQGNITSVILTGGHSRVPMVQAELKALVGECVADILLASIVSTELSIQLEDRAECQRRRIICTGVCLLRRDALPSVPHEKDESSRYLSLRLADLV